MIATVAMGNHDWWEGNSARGLERGGSGIAKNLDINNGMSFYPVDKKKRRKLRLLRQTASEFVRN